MELTPFCCVIFMQMGFHKKGLINMTHNSKFYSKFTESSPPFSRSPPFEWTDKASRNSKKKVTKEKRWKRSQSVMR